MTALAVSGERLALNLLVLPNTGRSANHDCFDDFGGFGGYGGFGLPLLHSNSPTS